MVTIAVVAGAVGVIYLGFELATRLTRDAAPLPTAPPEGAVTPDPAGPLPPGEQDAEGLRTVDVILYFSRPDALGLAPEARPIYLTNALLDRIKQTVVALIAGPAQASPLVPILPAGTPLLDLFLDSHGTLYLDLGQAVVRNLLPGTSSELLAVMGITDTLVANFPEVKQVQILVDGEEVRTLTGHLDLTYPLKADPSLILPPEVLPFPETP
ncbi:MAG: GerMN domain-containing protein [Acidobacteria bacterium]|nr:GerMN domain-containing protein [Acidobacteriota bacterium]